MFETGQPTLALYPQTPLSLTPHPRRSDALLLEIWVLWMRAAAAWWLNIYIIRGGALLEQWPMADILTGSHFVPRPGAGNWGWWSLVLYKTRKKLFCSPSPYYLWHSISPFSFASVLQLAQSKDSCKNLKLLNILWPHDTMQYISIMVGTNERLHAECGVLTADS